MKTKILKKVGPKPPFTLLVTCYCFAMTQQLGYPNSVGRAVFGEFYYLVAILVPPARVCKKSRTKGFIARKKYS